MSRTWGDQVRESVKITPRCLVFSAIGIVPRDDDWTACMDEGVSWRFRWLLMFMTVDLPALNVVDQSTAHFWTLSRSAGMRQHGEDVFPLHKSNIKVSSAKRALRQEITSGRSRKNMTKSSGPRTDPWASETSMSNEQRRATAFKLSTRDNWAESWLRARTWLQEKIQEKGKKKTRKEKENERRRNQYARVRRYKITSTLGLLVRGDPQNEGLRGLQPRALGSKLDYFHAGITSTRLHRCPSGLASLNHLRLSTKKMPFYSIIVPVVQFSGDRRFCYDNHGSFVCDSPNLFCGPSGSVRTGLTGVRSEPGHRTHLTSLLLKNKRGKAKVNNGNLCQERNRRRACNLCKLVIFRSALASCLQKPPNPVVTISTRVGPGSRLEAWEIRKITDT